MLVMKGGNSISKFAKKEGDTSSKLASTAFKIYQKHKYSPSISHNMKKIYFQLSYHIINYPCTLIAVF